MYLQILRIPKRFDTKKEFLSLTEQIDSCVKFSKNSWHYKLMFYIHGKHYFFYQGNKKYPKPINLCPYFRTVVGTMIIFPFVFALNSMPEPVKEHRDGLIGIIAWFFVSVIINIVSFIRSESLWWIGLAVFFGGVGLVASMIVLKLLLEKLSYKLYIRKRNKMRQNPLGSQKPPVLSLVGEFIRSKHEKICPCIEFVDEEKVQKT